MKNPLPIGLRSLALSFLCISGFTSMAQDTTSIEAKQLKTAFQTLQTQPFVWNGSSLSAYQSILASSRYNVPAVTQPFSMTNTTQLGLLKEMLDIIPANSAINVIPGTGTITYKPETNCIAIPANANRQDYNQVHIEYNTGSAPGAQDQTIFDIRRKDVCANVTSTYFMVDINGKIGFGTATPQNTYHFAVPKFQVGDNTTVQFKIDNTTNSENMTFSKAGQELFKVNKDGKASAREFEVTLTSPFPDYVFEKGYQLRSLSETESYIRQHKHLPGIKPASEYAEQGTVNVGELQLQLLEKIEELTLHAIEQQKLMELQQQRIEALEKQLAGK